MSQFAVRHHYFKLFCWQRCQHTFGHVFSERPMSHIKSLDAQEVAANLISDAAAAVCDFEEDFLGDFHTRDH